MSDSIDQPVYRCRRGAREQDAVWTLRPDGLERAEVGGPAQKMAYGEVKELRLLYEPARAAPHRFRCDLNSVAGHRVTLTSMSFVAPGAFEDRASSYVPFVRDLVQRVGGAAPPANSTRDRHRGRSTADTRLR